METTGDLVARSVELAAGVQHSHDYFGGWALLRWVLVDRNATAIVQDRDGVVEVNGDVDGIAMASEGFVDRVVNDLENEVVQTRPVVGVTDVHARPLPDRLQALENFDSIGGVVLIRGGRPWGCAQAVASTKDEAEISHKTARRYRGGSRLSYLTWCNI
jgi:hypothetical protein